MAPLTLSPSKMEGTAILYQFSVQRLIISTSTVFFPFQIFCSGFACSYRYLNEWNRKYFVAINSKQWDNGMSCGKCLTARCVDPMCTVNTPLTLFVADLCPECSHGDVDFSIPAYEELTGIWPHRLQIKWNWTDCPADKMSGTIRLDPKDGINAFWSAFYVSNSRLPLSRVTLDGKELERQQFNFWINSAPLGAAPHKLELEAQNGDKLTTTVDDMLKSQDLGIQF